MRILFDAFDNMQGADLVEFQEAVIDFGGTVTVTREDQPKGLMDSIPYIQEVLLMGTNASILVAALSHLRNKWKRGIIVDTREGAVLIRPSRSLPLGSVIVLKDESEETFRSSDSNEAIRSCVAKGMLG